MKQLSKLLAYFWLGLFIIIGTSLKGIDPDFQSGDYLVYSFSTNCKNRVAPFSVQHGSVISRNRSTHAPILTPLLKNTLRTIVRTLSVAERYDGGSVAQNYSGYFHPTRWTSDLLSGAGGVDVTGAPKSRQLVEGINANLMEVANDAMFEFYFIIPVKGALLLEWTFYGSSISTTSTIAHFSPVPADKGRRGGFKNATFWGIDSGINTSVCSEEAVVSTYHSKLQQAPITPRKAITFESSIPLYQDLR